MLTGSICVLCQGYNSRKEFIAAQGPLPVTVNEFWRMIWEKNVQTLVMLTRCNEQGRVSTHTHTHAHERVHMHTHLVCWKGNVKPAMLRLYAEYIVIYSNAPSLVEVVEALLAAFESLQTSLYGVKLVLNAPKMKCRNSTVAGSQSEKVSPFTSGGTSI